MDVIGDIMLPKIYCKELTDLIREVLDVEPTQIDLPDFGEED